MKTTKWYVHDYQNTGVTLVMTLTYKKWRQHKRFKRLQHEAFLLFREWSRQMTPDNPNPEPIRSMANSRHRDSVEAMKRYAGIRDRYTVEYELERRKETAWRSQRHR